MRDEVKFKAKQIKVAKYVNKLSVFEFVSSLRC